MNISTTDMNRKVSMQEKWFCNIIHRSVMVKPITYIPTDTSIVENFFFIKVILFILYLHNCHFYTYSGYTCSYENYDILLSCWQYNFLILSLQLCIGFCRRSLNVEEMQALLIKDQPTSEEYMNVQRKSSYLRYYWNYNTALFFSLQPSIYKYGFFSGSLQ